MSTTRLSALDASFLAVESAESPMHVGWVATFDGPGPGFAVLRDHLAERLEGIPRYRQKLAPVPLGLHEPVWADDPRFDPAEHLLHAQGADLDAIVDGILSTPLPRDRPLWQMWIADELPDDRVALIGKMHHCMVDGAAIAELGRRILDAAPDAEPPAEPEWSAPAPEPSRRARLARGALDRATDGARLVLTPARLATTPGRIRELPGLARTMAHTLLPPAPDSSLNAAGAAARRHVRVSRSLDDLRAVRRRFGVSPNDVVLAACAGGPRRRARRPASPPCAITSPRAWRERRGTARSSRRCRSGCTIRCGSTIRTSRRTTTSCAPRATTCPRSWTRSCRCRCRATGRCGRSGSPTGSRPRGSR